MSSPSRDPKLSGQLTAEYLALKNDLEQARNLATDYENQFRDKSVDFNALKARLDKTLGDLNDMQQHILALREERHRFANRAMETVALEKRVADMTAGLQRVPELEKRIAEMTAELERTRELEKRIADQTVELQRMREMEKKIADMTIELQRMRESKRGDEGGGGVSWVG